MPDIAGKNDITVSIEDIKNFIKKNPNEFRAIFDAFDENVKEEGENLGYFEKIGFNIVIIFIVISFVFSFITIYFAIRYNILFLIIYSIFISTLIFSFLFFCQDGQKLD